MEDVEERQQEHREKQQGVNESFTVSIAGQRREYREGGAGREVEGIEDGCNKERYNILGCRGLSCNVGTL